MNQHGSGMWDMTCPFCGFPLNGPYDPNPKSLFAWLNELVVISEKNPPEFGTYDGYGRIGKANIAQDDNIGLHKVCWEILGKPDYKWLKDRDLYTADEMWRNHMSEYIEDYIEQFADWDRFLTESDAVWAAYDPSQSAGNKNRQRLDDRLKKLGGPYGQKKSVKQQHIKKQVVNYPKLISDCAKGPKQGGLSIKELRELAITMGIEVKGLKKIDICNEIKKVLNQA